MIQYFIKQASYIENFPRNPTSSSLSSFYKTKIQFSRSVTPNSLFQLIEIGKKNQFSTNALYAWEHIQIVSNSNSNICYFWLQNHFPFFSEPKYIRFYFGNVHYHKLQLQIIDISTFGKEV
jgi:hypothetical protein